MAVKRPDETVIGNKKEIIQIFDIFCKELYYFDHERNLIILNETREEGKTGFHRGFILMDDMIPKIDQSISAFLEISLSFLLYNRQLQNYFALCRIIQF